jgi:hypothetical protein
MTGYGMDDRGSIPGRVGISPLQHVQTSFGTQSASYPERTVVHSTGVKCGQGVKPATILNLVVVVVYLTVLFQ